MKKFKIYCDGIGTATYACTEEFENSDEAMRYAYELACDDYDGYAGFHGIRSVEDIQDEENCSEEDAWEVYKDERDSCIDYYVKETDDDSCGEDE